MSDSPSSGRQSRGMSQFGSDVVAALRRKAGAAGNSPKLSNVERDVIAEIRAIRASDDHIFHAMLSSNPARLMFYFILSTHGHVQLHFSHIAHELAVENRTLQRAFRRAFKISMRRCQIKVRLSYAKEMLSAIPPMKMSVIAVTLGYRATSDFLRFFEGHMASSPSKWRREQL